MITYEVMFPGAIDDVYEVERECFTQPWSKQLFADELNNPLTYYLVARCNDKVIGYGGMWSIMDEGHITNIAVIEEYRNQGIGSGLIEEFIAFARQSELRILTLEVRRSNLTAQRLYEKFGFEIVGERRGYYEGKEDAILMTLQI